MKQSLRLSQQMVMTPQLQMAIKLLQVSRMELLEQVREELKENPFLEDVGETQAEQVRDDPEARAEMQLSGETETPAPQLDGRGEGREVPVDGQPAGDVDWEAWMENMATAPSPPVYRLSDEELPSIEQTYTRRTSLAEHLIRQLNMANLPEEHRYIGLLIIGNLDSDGYFKDPPLEEIVEEAEAQFGLPPGSLQEAGSAVLRRIQRFDPVGCAARTLQECLLVQAEVLGIDDEVLTRMLTEHLQDLEKKNYAKIARDLKVDIEEIYEAAKDIQRLDPRPGREYSTEEPQYITPDVYIHKIGDQYFVTVNDDGLPKLKISSYYLNTMRQRENKEAREYVQERLRSARWLIDSIQQRQRTIVRVTESILKFQREFFDKGINYLKPLTLRDIADDINMHESTISRATSNKYVHTPQGLFELKYFFNAGISKEGGGEDIASEAVKRLIKGIIQSEDPKNPYSDQKIVELLRDRHKIDIARRTVAKYREQLGILPSAQRKQVF
ncbi:MAG: RNA polymerase factor sigma-54 [Myxococcales bacterium]|nr:RNA polymerase factor sigma-54 [Myxococcales bacterium]